MVKSLVLMAVLAGAGMASAQDEWHFKASEHKSNLLFSDFKYFDFKSDSISGNITYYVVGPVTTSRLYVTGHFSTKDRVWSYQRAYDLGCVTASASNASLDLCGTGGGITVLGDGHYLIQANEGSVRWALDVSAARSFVGDTVTSPLDSVAPLGIDRKLFPWEMNWRPEFVSALVSGEIRLGEGDQIERYRLNQARGYHDENWGVWFPAKQPYQWVQFNGTDQNGEPLQIVYGGFYKQQGAGTMLVYTAGGSRVYFASELSVAITASGRASTHEVNLLTDREQLFVDPAKSEFVSGDHAIPTEFEIRANDGSFALRAKATLNDSTSVQEPRAAKWLAGTFIQNEQILAIDAQVRLGSSAFEAHGLGEHQYGSSD